MTSKLLLLHRKWRTEAVGFSLCSCEIHKITKLLIYQITNYTIERLLLTTKELLFDFDNNCRYH